MCSGKAVASVEAVSIDFIQHLFMRSVPHRALQRMAGLVFGLHFYLCGHVGCIQLAVLHSSDLKQR